MSIKNRYVWTAAAVIISSLASHAYAADFNPRGRFHLDAGGYDSDVTQFGNGVNIRRGRMGVSGRLDDNWSFQIEYDFAEGGGGSATDVFVRRRMGPGTVAFGQNLVPTSMNILTSSNNITFMERSSIVNMNSLPRRLGVRYDINGDNYTSQTMLFSRGMNDNPDGDDRNEPVGIAQRLVFNTSLGGGSLVHMGATASFEDRAGFTGQRFRDRPELRIANSIRLIDTGTIADASSITRYGLEAAFRSGPFSVEAEYLGINVSSENHNDPQFDGFHVQMSYVLTGESRGYRNGIFGGISPASSSGAWEVAARYSEADLDDHDIFGGKQSNLTLGLNYYASSNVRFMANVVFVDVEREQINDSPTIAAARVQYAF